MPSRPLGQVGAIRVTSSRRGQAVEEKMWEKAGNVVENDGKNDGKIESKKNVQSSEDAGRCTNMIGLGRCSAVVQKLKM